MNAEQRRKKTAYTKRWYRKNRVRLLKYHRVYRLKHTAWINARNRRYYRANRERMLAANRRYLGIPEATHRRPKYCECCFRTVRKWYRDHNHKTKKFRGWLCHRCNLGIGQLGDSPAGVRRALNYLLRA